MELVRVDSLPSRLHLLCVVRGDSGGPLYVISLCTSHTSPLLPLSLCLSVVVRGDSPLRNFDELMRTTLMSEMKKQGLKVVTGFSPKVRIVRTGLWFL